MGVNPKSWTLNSEPLTLNDLPLPFILKVMGRFEEKIKLRYVNELKRYTIDPDTKPQTLNPKP
jgi:hypothetical protein